MFSIGNTENGQMKKRGGEGRREGRKRKRKKEGKGKERKSK